MFVFYLAMFVVKAFLVSLVYQDLSVVIGLPKLNFLQILMVLSFLVTVKMVIFGSDYASVEVFRKMTDVEKIAREVGTVLTICFFSAIYFVAKVLL